MEIADKWIQLGYAIKTVLNIVGLLEATYYARRKNQAKPKCITAVVPLLVSLLPCYSVKIVYTSFFSEEEGNIVRAPFNANWPIPSSFPTQLSINLCCSCLLVTQHSLYKINWCSIRNFGIPFSSLGSYSDSLSELIHNIHLYGE